MHSLKLACSLVSRSIKPCSLRCMSAAASADTFKASDLQIKLGTGNELRSKPDPDSLVFGKEFSDHMLEIDWSEAGGWGKPVISPIHNFSMHPAAKVYHYAVELFEGMKVYRGVDNKVRMFRPDCNMERMLSSAERSSFPSFDGEELIKCLKKLITIDQEWVPYSTTSTLYVRPTMIGTEASLGVSKSMDAKLFVITGPVGPYYPTGFKPVSLLADPKHVRAWEGGCGSYKMGSNYAPTIAVQIEALKKYDCQQVLWLYGKDHQLTEVGTMNLFVFWENEQGEKELVTPPLSQGIILPGVTRKTLLDLTRTWGEFKVSEKIITMKEVTKALDSGRLKEMFGAGTACVVAPVSSIMYDGSKIDIPTMDDGAPLTMRLYKELTDIQFGRTKHEWAVEI